MIARFGIRSLLLLGLTASPASAAILTVAWDAQSDANGYVVHYGTSPGAYSMHVDVGGNAALVIRDLQPGTRYYFAVQAYNSNNQFSPFSAEINTVTDVALETAETVNVVPEVGARDLDAAFDATTRRYLLTFTSGGRPYALLLDVWGSLIGGPFSLADGASGGIQPRVAAGNGRFLVAFTDTLLGQRLARFVVPAASSVTLSQTYSLGAATSSSSDADGSGSAIAYATANRFLATWENSGAVFVRPVGLAGPQGTALDLTTDLAESGCSFSRPEIVWDPSQSRAVVAGSRYGSTCAGGTAVWIRLLDGSGSQLSPLGSETILTTSADPHSYIRLGYDVSANRFLAAWSQRRPDGTTTLSYRLGDSTGGLSALRTIESGGKATASLDDDSYTDNAIAFDGSGGFSLISRAAPSSPTSAGVLFTQRLDASAQVSGMLHELPAVGYRTYTAAIANSISGQVLVAYVDTAGHARALTIGHREATRVEALTASPIQATGGTPVAVTAQAGGGVGPYEYRFWLYDATRAQWTPAAPFSTTSTFQWTPPVGTSGNYTVQVWARSVGSVADYEAWRNAQITVTPPGPVAVTLTADRGFPVPAGTQILWTASGSGGIAPLQHQFWLYDGTAGTWSIAQAYSSATSFAWAPSRAGQYALQVWTRSGGSTASYDGWAGSGLISIAAPGPVTVTSLVADRTTVAPGSPITWTATAGGGLGSFDYQFWRYNLSTATWTLAQPYSSAATYQWMPPINDVGSHLVQVWVRTAGSTSSYDTWRSSDTVTVSNITLRSLSTTTLSPAAAGTSIRWTASAAAVTGTIEYRFWVYSSTTGWQLLRDWAPTSSATWVPTTAGRYAFQVWARTVGSTHDLEAWLGSDYFIIQ